MNPDNKYTKMQKEYYDKFASQWTPEIRDPVVGNFDKHNAWAGWDNLFKDLNTKEMVGIDFGCGPGRNIVKFSNQFKQLDGVDISQINLDKALVWFAENGGISNSKLFQNNGTDLSVLADASYDLIMSTITLQHICVHDIRLNYLKEFFRVLKPGGVVTVQMGFGSCPQSIGYFANNYDAESTNWYCDTRIEDPDQIKDELEQIGFLNFSHTISETGPGDWHSNWIFWRAFKP